ncbi:MAG: CBS domain-containing protein [Nanoarchaeota archaeon]
MIKECTLFEALQCKEGDSVVDIAKKFKEYAVRYMYVTNVQDQLLGVISLSDINNRVVAEGKDPNALKAKDIMTKNLKAFDDQISEHEAYKQCIREGRTACPVTSKGKLVGVITVQSLLNHITNVK